MIPKFTENSFKNLDLCDVVMERQKRKELRNILSEVHGLNATFWEKNPEDSEDCSENQDATDESENANDATSNEADDE